VNKGFANYRFRQLGSADVALLKDLSRVLGEAFDEADTYQGAIPSDEYLAGLLSLEKFVAIVAMTAEQVVGGLAAYVLDKFERDRREIYIYDLAVQAAHRRKGIATGLIEELKKVAAQRGAYVIFVQADMADTPAIAFYEALGAKKTTYHFDIKVKARNPGHA
jgi:aminoglycoside 3-N-acetyltransferase I